MHLPDNVNKTIAEFLSVNTIKTDIVIYQYTGCKKNTHSHNCNLCNLTYNPTKIFDYLKNGTDSTGNITFDNTFLQTGTDEEIQLYEEKYIIKDVYFGLFNNFVKELEIDNFNISNRNYEYTINSCSWYYEINGSKTVKNKLRVINKIYKKYTRSKKLK